jgi:hypothetical protein
MSTHAQMIRLRVICINPPPEGNQRPLLFGLQDKQGNLQIGQPRSDGVLVYECDVKATQHDNGKPNFTGSHTHGTPDERFLYISVRSIDDSSWLWRSKIMLRSITWEMVEAAIPSSYAIEITVDGIAAGRAKVVRGWEVTQS